MSDQAPTLELIGLDPEWVDLRIPLTPPRMDVGRDPENHIALEEDSVSGSHARLIWEDDRWWIEDLGSTNGTELNDEDVLAKTALSPHDRVMFGGLTFQVIPPGAEEDISFPSATEETLVDSPLPVIPLPPEEFSEPRPAIDPTPSLMPEGASPADPVPSSLYLWILMLLTTGVAILLFTWLHLLLRP